MRMGRGETKKEFHRVYYVIALLHPSFYEIDNIIVCFVLLLYCLPKNMHRCLFYSRRCDWKEEKRRRSVQFEGNLGIIQ